MTDVAHQPPEPSPAPPGTPPSPAPARPESAAGWLQREAPALARALGRLRRRAGWVVLLQDLFLGLAAAAVVLLAAVLLLVLKQEWARSAGWVGAALVFLAGSVRGLWRARRVAGDSREAARALGRVAPGEASDLLSAVELAEEALRPETNLSTTLVRAHLSRMGAIALALDPRGAVRSAPALWALLAVGALALVHAGLALKGPERVRTAYAYLGGSAAAEAAPLFAPEPIAGDVTLTYRYPAHMNRPPRTVAGTAGDIAAPKGTLVEVTAHADRDVQRAFAVVGKSAIPLQIQGRQVSGQLLVSGPGDWRFRWAKESGGTVAEGPPRPITIEPDAFPEVKLTQPEAEKEIQGGEVLTLQYNATDDYGLTGLDLVWSTGKGGQEQRKSLLQFKDNPRRQRGDLTWDLRPLNLKPGDRVTYRLEAQDNDTVSGLKKGVSQTQVLKVFSESEHHQEVLKKATELWERLVSGLGDRLEEPGPGDKGEKATDGWLKAGAVKDGLLGAVATDMRRLGRELAEDPKAPVEIGRALLHVGGRVGQANQKTSMARQTVVRRPSPPSARQFAASLAGETDEVEKGVLYLEDLMDRRRLLDLAEMTRELQQGRQELSRLVEQYKKAPDEQTRRQLLDEVARLKERLHDLYKRMQELSREIQDEHLNEEAQQMMEQGDDMLSQLDEVQRQLAKGDSDEALKALEKLQKELENMEKRFSEGAGEMSEEQREVSRELQNLASELLDVQAEQQAVKQGTDQLRQKQKEAAQKKLQQLGQEFVQKQKERVERAQNELKGVDQKVAEQMGEDEALQGALDRLGQLEQALKSGDFDEALEQAAGALQQGQEMRQRMNAERETAKQFPGYVRDPRGLEQSAERVERAERPMREVAEDLEKLLRSARPQPSEQERQAMKDLAQRQGGVQRRTEDLQQRFDQLGQKMPLFGPQQQKLLQEAAGQMGEAKGKLGEGDSRGASGRQGDALERLEAMRKAMQQSQQQQGGGGGIPMPFGPSGSGEGGEQDGDGQQARNEKVEIPSADQSRAPEEFRKDILDAMKDKAPERYKERVRDYYEELVK